MKFLLMKFVEKIRNFMKHDNMKLNDKYKCEFLSHPSVLYILFLLWDDFASFNMM